MSNLWNIESLLKKERHSLTTQCGVLMTLRKRPVENIVGKGENGGNQHFHLFTQWFLNFKRQTQLF